MYNTPWEGSQVFAVFSSAFWPEGLFDVVCTDCLVPEFWITCYPSPQDGAGATSSDAAGSAQPTDGLPSGGGQAQAREFVVTGFAAGEPRATALGGMRPGNLLLKFLQQLDTIFGGMNVPFAIPRPMKPRGAVALWHKVC